MKKIFKNSLFTFILGVLCTITIGVGATAIYNASEIGFTPSDSNWKVNNMQDAINDLYNNSGSKIVKLSDSVVTSNTSYTYDVSNINGYENFTADNFFYAYAGFSWVGNGNIAGGTGVVSYDNSTGTVTFPAVPFET